jgi:hypothetical protein
MNFLPMSNQIFIEEFKLNVLIHSFNRVEKKMRIKKCLLSFLPIFSALSETVFRFLDVRFLRQSSINVPETLKMPSLSGLGKRRQGILRNQSIGGFFGFKSYFQNCFWNFFSTSGLSQIC